MNWPEKYRPRSLSDFSDVYGQCQTFLMWLRSWTPEVEQKFAILYGKPGTGKTTIVLAAAKTMDLDVCMTNASDARNKEDMKNVWQAAVSVGMGDNKRLILLDEADNISDAAQGMILKMAERSRHPIVLTCNDVFSLNKEVRGAKSFRLQFNLPMRDDKVVLAKRVVRAEGLGIDAHELDHVVDRSMTYRDLLHNLQLCSIGIFGICEGIPEENLFDEFMSVMEGHAPDKTNFKPDELLKWMVEYSPQSMDRIHASNRILSRIRGERSTKDVHQHAWKYSGRVLRTVRGVVDRPRRMVNGFKVQLPFESSRIYSKIRKDNPREEPKEKKKAEKISRVGTRLTGRRKIEPGDVFSRWA